MGKLVSEVLRKARGRRLRAVLKTEGTVFPTGKNCITCLFFSVGNYFIRNICVGFLLKQFHIVRVRLTFQ